MSAPAGGPPQAPPQAPPGAPPPEPGPPAADDRARSEPGKWPTELRVNRAEKRLSVTFEDGSSFTLPAELLRVESPSAEVQGHGPSQKTILAGRRHVGIMELEPVGNYAVRILFDDLHSTGIFSWRYLHYLGRNREKLWTEYLKALQDRGLSRDP